MKLLREDELPHGFAYPGAFRRAVARGLTHLEPWWVLRGDQLRSRIGGLRERFPDRKLVPFARREDNDDVACWEAGGGEEVFVIHDYSSNGWEQRRVFPDFYAWLRQAVEDMIEFDRFEDQ